MSLWGLFGRYAEGAEAAEMTTEEGLHQKFHRRMIRIYKDAKGEGYVATRFLRMITEQGALDAARMLLAAREVSDGFTTLWELQRLDLSVEAVILEEPRWRPLFTDEERDTARKRLAEYGYHV